LKAWVYVEGRSDELALQALWSGWRGRLQAAGHSIKVIPLDDKQRFFHRLGSRAADKFVANAQDLVVGLPDLYPNKPFESGPCRHADLAELQAVQRRLVEEGLRKRSDVAPDSVSTLLGRFHPAALKHDLEMLLLAAKDELRRVLDTQDKLGHWRLPVEEQNQDKPPKFVVEELFRTKSRERRAYRETRDAPKVLGAVSDVQSLLHTESGQLNCPVFKAMLDWLGQRFGIPAYA